MAIIATSAPLVDPVLADVTSEMPRTVMMSIENTAAALKVIVRRKSGLSGVITALPCETALLLQFVLMRAAGGTAPSSTPAPDDRLESVRGFFVLLRKGAKTIGMYRHSPERFGEFLRPAFDALTAVLQTGHLSLTVSADNFLLGDAPVWPADGGTTVSSRFFREGLRHLVFRPGLTAAELQQLVLIMITPERGGPELTAQLFDAAFTHVEYAVVQGFSLGDLSEEEVEARVGAIADELVVGLHGGAWGRSFAADAEALATELERQLEDLEASTELVEGRVSEAFRRHVRQELETDTTRRLPVQLAALVLEGLAGGWLRDGEATTRHLVEMLDLMLAAGSLASLASLLDAIEERTKAGPPLLVEVRAVILAALGEAPRLEALCARARAGTPIDVGSVSRYLDALRPTALPALLQILGHLEHPELRALVLATTAALARDNPQPVVDRLATEDPGAIRDAFAVLTRQQTPTLGRHIEHTLHHPHAAARIEALTALAAAGLPEAWHRLALDATRDKVEEVRLAAFRCLVQLAPAKGFEELSRLPSRPDWDNRSPAERQVIFECIGRTATPEALAYLTRILQLPKRLFFGGKQVEAKLLVVHALRQGPTLETFKIVQAAASSKDIEAEVAHAARQAALEIRRLLTPGAKGPPR